MQVPTPTAAPTQPVEQLAMVPPPMPAFDFRASAAETLGSELSEAVCTDAADRVAADAWDLEALVDYGLCLGAEGRVADSDTVLKRMLTFDPGSHRALVGRALNAQAQGDRRAALALYDDALAANPSAEAAARIETARASLEQSASLDPLQAHR